MTVYYRVSDTASWVQLTHYPGNISTWTLHTLELPSPTDRYFICFKGYSYRSSSGIGLDDVSVNGAMISPTHSGEIIAGDTLRFLGTGQVLMGSPSFFWDFGDGRSSTEENPGLIAFPSTGMNEVIFNVISFNGQTNLGDDRLLTISEDTGSIPDLEVTRFTIPADIPCGQPTELTYRVTNVGDGDIIGGAWQDAVYLSEDHYLDLTDTLLNTDEITGDLPVDGFYDGAITVTFDPSEEGACCLILSIDDEWEILELHQLNNESPNVGFIISSIPDDQFLHETVRIIWSGFKSKAVEFSANVSASREGQEHTFGTGLEAYGYIDWDTTLMPDGEYELRASFFDDQDQVVGEATRIVLVNNSAAYHSGRIEVDETWTADSVHIVAETVYVADGAHLTIEAGAVIKFIEGAGIVVEDGGILDAFGLEGLEIIFTSFADDTAGGDTNLDGNQTNPQPGDWSGLSSEGNGQINLNEYVDVRYVIYTDSGTLSNDETWAGTGVFHISGNITVPAGVTLTIKPGAVVKIKDKGEITVQSGGTLIAEGTVAEPIFFTSVKDDSAGGDTNGDGDSTTPAAGDWRWIHLDGGSGSFDHVRMRYGGGTASGQWDQTGMLRTSGGAQLNISNSRLEDAFYDGILAWGFFAQATVESCMVRGADRGICAHPYSTVNVVNCTVDDNRIGILLHFGRVNIVNTLMTNNAEYGFIASPVEPRWTIRYSDSWNSGVANFGNIPDQAGLNGNISADPFYKSRERGDFRLSYVSPVIDAADGTAAPGTDFMGAPRYDDPRTPNTGVQTPGGEYADMGAYEFVETEHSDIDLVVGAVTGPIEAVAGEEAEVSWTVRNNGTGTAVGPWHDTVSLVLDPDDVAEVFEAGVVLSGAGVTLGPGESCEVSGMVRVPGSIAADHYWRVTANSRGEVFEGINTGNNTADSLSPVSLDLPELVVDGAPLNREFSEAGESHWFKFEPEAGLDVGVSLDLEGAGATELYIARDYMPTRERYDVRQTEWNSADVSALAAGTADRTYYVLAYADSLPGGATGFSIEADALGFALDSVDLDSAANAGTVTFAVQGGQLRDDMTYEIIDCLGGVHQAVSVFLVNPSLAYVTFDLTGLPECSYSIRVSDGPLVLTLDDCVEVTAGSAGKLDYHITVPVAIRRDWSDRVIVNYRNAGQTDLVAPYMVMEADGARLRWPGEDEWRGDSIPLLGINREGPAGILPPGAGGSITLEMEPLQGLSNIKFDLQVENNPDATFDWGELEDDFRPPAVTAGQWAIIYDNFEAAMGNTLGQCQAVLAENATRLSRFGEYVADADRLLDFELVQADPLGDMAFRGQPGSMGLGGPDLTDISAVADAYGDVTVTAAGYSLHFTLLGDGSYQSPSGYRGTLEADPGGFYVLDEGDGDRTVFRPDGKLDYFEDFYGNRVIASYSGGRLRSLTIPSGESIDFFYDAEGRVSRYTDVADRTTYYGYDDEGRFTNYTSFFGFSAEYSYFTSGPALNAVRSVSFSNGESMTFEYDGGGRLIRVSNGEDFQVIAYDSAGGYRFTNAAGADVTVLRDDSRRAREVISGADKFASSSYDDEGNLNQLLFAGGISQTYDHNESGKITFITNPLGERINFAYNQDDGELTSIRDPRGNLTQYGHDTAGNLSSITYPNGAMKSFSYDEEGRLSSRTERNGDEVSFVYDDGGLLVRKEIPGGESIDYTYDARFNLVSATDSSGTTEMIYSPRDELIRVTYPDGRWLEFGYDENGRKIRTADGSGFEVNYEYDSRGRLSAINHSGDHLNARRGAGDGLITAYSFDAAGRVTRQDAGNGSYTIYGYDEGNKLASLANHDPAGTIVSSYNYTYDELGRRTNMTTLMGTYSYTYDAADRLTSVSTPASRVLTYGYDGAGNRVSVSNDGDTTEYTTNELDQYTAVGDNSYGYDANGRLSSKTIDGESWEYSYNYDGQPASITGPGESWTFEYNVFGQRTASVHNGMRREYLPDPTSPEGAIFAEYDGSGDLLYHHVSQDGMKCSVDAGGDFIFYNFDGNGNTVEVTDSSGEVLNEYEYLPYGEKVQEIETIPNQYKFRGRYAVEDLGNDQNLNGTRIYDSTDGRFNAEADLPGESSYNFADNQPTIRRNPGGSNAIPDWGSDARDILDQFDKAGQWFKDIEYMLGEIYKEQDIFSSMTRVDDELKNFVMSKKFSLKNIGKGCAKSKFFMLLGWIKTSEQSAYLLEELQKWQKGESDGYDVMKRFGYWLSQVISMSNNPWAVLVDRLLPLWDLTTQEIADYWYRVISPPATVAYGPRARELWNGATPRHLQGFKPGADGRTPVLGSIDPNDIVGPNGEPALNWIHPDQTLAYTVRFENQSTASAPAQVVTVTHQLDDDLDWTTFELVGYGFGDYTASIPAGLDAFDDRLDFTESLGLFIDLDFRLDRDTGVVTWEFTSIDPVTGEQTRDPFAGFLPPNLDPPEGEGYLSYTIRPLSTVTTNDVVDALASIVFDTNEPIETPLHFNTFDDEEPASSASSPAVSNSESFTVNWSGSDTGAGIASFDLYAATDGGEFGSWLIQTTVTSAPYRGAFGHTYGFYSLARDAVGNEEDAPGGADTTTMVIRIITPTTTPFTTQATPPAVTPTPFPTPECLVIASGDYNGDGISDIAIFRQDIGLWAIRGLGNTYFGRLFDIPASGDYDGDGIADVAVFRPSTGLWAVKDLTRLYLGRSGDIPVPGDYDGDGYCDPAVFRRSSCLWRARGVTAVYFGIVGDRPVPGDYDNDGTDEIAVFRPGTGLWAVRGLTRIYFGAAGDLPIPAVYRWYGGSSPFSEEPAIFRPPTGLWAVRGGSRIYFGSTGDIPLPAAFSGGPLAENGIYRPSVGLWAIRGITRVYFGRSGDSPVTR